MTAPDVVGCFGQHSACTVRFTRLDSTCTPVPGDTGGIVIEALATATTTPDVEAGTKFEPKDACGRTVYVDEDPDVIKRQTLALEFILFDPTMAELITDGGVILGAAGGDYEGKVIGFSTPGPESIYGKTSGMEIWVKNANGAGPCGPDGTFPPYVRHVWPRCLLSPADRTFDNTSATFKFSGTGTPNPQWDDPWGDWPGATFDPLSPYQWAYDTELPDAECGYVTLPPAGS